MMVDFPKENPRLILSPGLCVALDPNQGKPVRNLRVTGHWTVCLSVGTV